MKPRNTISCVIIFVAAYTFNLQAQPPSSSNVSPDETTTQALVTQATKAAEKYRVALEMFYVDHNCYPVHTTETAHMTQATGAPAGTPSFKNLKVPPLPYTTSKRTPRINLTTPISYLTHLLPDPFSGSATSPFAYYGDCHGYLVWTAGPDRKWDIDWTTYDTSKPPTEAFKVQYTYDPTNGVVSSGDIWRGSGGHP